MEVVAYAPPAGENVSQLGAQKTGNYSGNWGLEAIGAAYAHMRGASGSGVTISVMGGKIDSDHTELYKGGTKGNALVAGYGYVTTNDNDDMTIDSHPSTDASVGRCVGTAGCGDDDESTSVAGIITGRAGGGEIRGIAYNSQIKPIDVLTDGVAHGDTDLAGVLTLNLAGSPMQLLPRALPMWWLASGIIIATVHML